MKDEDRVSSLGKPKVAFKADNLLRDYYNNKDFDGDAQLKGRCNSNITMYFF